MNRRLLLISSFAGLLFAAGAHSDPIHAIEGGGYWHHDSGWVFPQEVAGFSRVGAPQDVAGSRDAVAYYARVIDGSRIVASVDVYPADSAAAPAMSEVAGKPIESPFEVGTQRALSGKRVLTLSEGGKNGATLMYFITAGEWRVRIHCAGVSAESVLLLDSFAREQRWESLSAAPTPR